MNVKSNKNSRKKYKVKNWPEYDKALKERGNIAVWITEEAIKAWNPRANWKTWRTGSKLIKLFGIKKCSV